MGIDSDSFCGLQRKAYTCLKFLELPVFDYS